MIIKKDKSIILTSDMGFKGKQFEKWLLELGLPEIIWPSKSCSKI